MNKALATAMRAGSAARRAAAVARRLQMAQLRTAVQMHMAQNHHRRRQVSDALVHLRGNCAAMRTRVRKRLQQGAAPPAAPDPVVSDPLQARVLQVLERHPRGVDAREIGNELGLDWRSVIAATTALVGHGLADQIDQDFYRAGKASPKC